MSENSGLRIFVAMPVKAMGEGAPWGDVKEIRQKLLAPAAAEIGRRLGLAVNLVIEDEKKIGGDIPTSMFAEASDADVYIADLTGFSANVFLELGVRWAVRDAVTILISQDVSNLKFNVAYNRAIEYGPMPTKLEQAVSDIAEFAVVGIKNNDSCDSPVRRGNQLIAIARTKLESLMAELVRLKSQQGEDLVNAAENIDDAKQKIDLLRRATEVNPASFTAHLRLGIVLRLAGRYDESEDKLETAARLDSNSALAWRELGATRNKSARLHDAAAALEISLSLDPDHSETWSTVGSLKRRLARRDGSIDDWSMLRESWHAYERASELNPNDSYGEFNAALLQLILTLHDEGDSSDAISRFDALEDLCRFQVKRNKSDPWKRLDLSATLAILEKEDEAKREAKAALSVAGETLQTSYIDSAVPPLLDLLQVNSSNVAQANAVQAVVELLQAAANMV
jgi:tetratricopeptide (TPR) repeat protein